MTRAFRTVARERSYSRTSGRTSMEAVTATPGSAAAQQLGDRGVRGRGGRSCAAGRPRRPPRPGRGGAAAAAATLVSSRGIRTVPPGPIRSVTSRMARGRTGRAGLIQAYRLEARGMSWRPISSTWRKPAVVTRAVRAPLPSRIRLVATVVPCSIRPTAPAPAPARSSARWMPVRKASDGSCVRGGGCLGAQHAGGGGVLHGDVGEGAADVDGDDQPGVSREHRRTPGGGRRLAFGRSARRAAVAAASTGRRP